MSASIITSNELSTLRIHKFPSVAAFEYAANLGNIEDTDISFVEGNTVDVPIPSSQDQGYVLTAGASGQMYWNSPSGGSGSSSIEFDTNTRGTINTSTGGSDTIAASDQVIALSSNRLYDFYGITANTTFRINATNGINTDSYILVTNLDGGSHDIDFTSVSGVDKIVKGDDFPVTLSTSKSMEFSIVKTIDLRNHSYVIITHSDEMNNPENPV